jgi:transposase-like protein
MWWIKSVFLSVAKQGRKAKMSHHDPDSRSLSRAMEILTENGLDGMAHALEIVFNAAMRIERGEFLGAGPFERTDERIGHANGFKPRRIQTRAGILDLAIPQVRGLDDGETGFYPRSLERGVRSERALKLALAEMYVQGVSTRKVLAITEKLCGFEVSSSQVSRATQSLDAELQTWRERPIGEIPYLILDARYEKVRQSGAVIDCAVLIAIGITPHGRRTILGVSVSLSEAEVHWRQFLASLRQRGLHGVRLVISDDHAGLKAARQAELTGVPWQRCQFHLQRNAMAYVPKISMRREVARALRSIFNAPDREEARRRLQLAVDSYRHTAPRLAAWIDDNVPEGLTIFDFPEHQRRNLRTTNLLENLNREVRRRTRVATIFPNDASLLRLVSAVLVEVSDGWETDRIYIAMGEDR